MELITAAAARAMDEYTIHALGVPSLTLMERAARHVADTALGIMTGDTAAIFCGPGNNGGDGVGAAMELVKAGKSVRVFLIGDRDRLTPDTAEMVRRLASLGVELESLPDDAGMIPYLNSVGVIIDAIYGFGFHLPLREEAARACRLMNGSPAPIVAADIPSGVETDTGFADPDAVRADMTVTFSRAKIGQFITPGALCCGEVLVRDIGVTPPPDATAPTAFTVDEEDVRLPLRRRDAHKGDFGKCLILAGSVGYTGAPAFAARAAVRSGAGLVFLGVPRDIYAIEAIKNDEAMVFPLSSDSGETVREVLKRLEQCDAVLIGPGWGLSQWAKELVWTVLENARVPVIVDADGITAVSRHIERLDKLSCPLILTPHDGEFARLSDGLKHKDRLTAARDFATEHGVILVLKGYRTVTAFPDGTAFINTTGNPGMATGGSGDVLAGMILSLVGQKLPLTEAIPWAVNLHGAAGDACAAAMGEYAMTPSDMIESLKSIMR